VPHCCANESASGRLTEVGFELYDSVPNGQEAPTSATPDSE
jgi:hypothetical protein